MSKATTKPRQAPPADPPETTDLPPGAEAPPAEVQPVNRPAMPAPAPAPVPVPSLTPRVPRPGMDARSGRTVEEIDEQIDHCRRELAALGPASDVTPRIQSITQEIIKNQRSLEELNREIHERIRTLTIERQSIESRHVLADARRGDLKREIDRLLEDRTRAPRAADVI